jgi:DNA-binding response OmpR family regulator
MQHDARRTETMATLKKILLVDDDDDLREALSEQLIMTEDFDVFEAGTGRSDGAGSRNSSTTS